MLRKVDVGFTPWAHKHQWDQTGPKCLTCIKPDAHGIFKPRTVTSWELVENMEGCGKQVAKMLVKCHGAEELVSFDMGTIHWTLEDVAKKFQQHRWFNPHEMAGIRQSR